MSTLFTKYANELGAERVAFLKQWFADDSFITACSSVFHRVDVDNSHSLDKKELLSSFRMILRESGQADKLLDAGVDLIEYVLHISYQCYIHKHHTRSSITHPYSYATLSI